VSTLSRRRARAARLFVAPTIAVLTLTAGWPLLRTVAFSLTDATLADLRAYRFIGLENFVYLAQDPAWWQAVRNTIGFTVTSVLIETVLGLIIALALHASLPGRAFLRAAILIPWAIPTLGLYNRLSGLVLAYMIFTLPFTVWVLTTFMAALPTELEEAAIIDGASPWVITTRVFLPLLGPALASTGLLAFVAAWNEFLFALTFTLSSSRRTVPVAIALMSGSSQFELPWGHIMAASVIVTAPLVVLVLVWQRWIVSGLTAGAVKG
jgi:trehalose/maltose transport system permease protein